MRLLTLCRQLLKLRNFEMMALLIALLMLSGRPMALQKLRKLLRALLMAPWEMQNVNGQLRSRWH
jgi:hypothetical protein